MLGGGHLFAGRVQGGKGGEQNSDGRTCCVVQNSTQCCAIASSLALSNTGLGRSSHLSSPHAVVFVLVFVLDLFKCRVVGRAHVVLSGQHSRRNARTSAAIMTGGGVRTRRAVAQVPNACGVGRGRAKASETARGRRRDDAPPADESRSCRGRSRAVLLVGVASVGWQCDGMGGGQGWLAGCWGRMRGGSQGPRPPLRVVCLFFFPPRNTVFPFSLFPCCNRDSTAGGNGSCATGQYLAEIWCKDNGRTGIGWVPLGLGVPCNHTGESGPMVVLEVRCIGCMCEWPGRVRRPIAKRKQAAQGKPSAAEKGRDE